MRHERPLPGQPTPIEELNAAIFKRRLDGTNSRQTRADIADGAGLASELRDAVLADMVEILDQGRLDRGYADVFDLRRSGYTDEAAARLGPHAAKLLAKRIADTGARDGLDSSEAA